MSDSLGNVVLANVYGRTADGLMRPLLVGPNGGIGGGLETISDWPAAPYEADVLTPLVAMGAYGDSASALIFGMRVDAASLNSVTFYVQASEDGIHPAKSLSYEFTLAPGEHDVFVTAFPLLHRYWQMYAEPAGLAKFDAVLRKLSR